MYPSSYIIGVKLLFCGMGDIEMLEINFQPVIAITSASASSSISSARIGLTTDIVCYSTNMTAVSNLPHGCA